MTQHPVAIASISGLLLLVMAGVTMYALPPMLDARFNAVLQPQRTVSPHAQALHQSLFIADLHADALLWNRDPAQRNDRGHVDLPRMLEGTLALQVFTIVTRVPPEASLERTPNRGDLITALAVAQGWPPRTWRSLAQRTLYQAERLHTLEKQSGGQFRILRTADDLRTYMARRESEPALAAGLLGIEGAHALDGDLDNVDRFFDADIRMIAPTHFFDNEWAGSAHGVEKGGLTERGRELIRRMETRGILLDLAHISPQALDDALAVATKPVVISHTGVRGTCDNARNLSDQQIRAVADGGGVIGIGFWPVATCGGTAADISRSIRHVIDIAGLDHVGLGSDWDGMVAAPFDAAGLAMLTEALVEDGYEPAEIAQIMGGNVVRVLLDVLP